MTETTTIHDLKALVQSSHALLAIETVEEDRVSEVLKAVALELRMPFFDWSLTRGLVRVPGTAAYYATEDPLMVLKHIDTLTVEAIFHLKDFADHLQNAALRRTLRELCQKFRPSRSTVVITGDPIELPRDLDQIAVKIDFQLPVDDELRFLLSSAVRSLRTHGAVDVKLGEDDLEGLLRALRGLTLGQARQALSLAMIEDRQLTAADIGR